MERLRWADTLSNDHVQASQGNACFLAAVRGSSPCRSPASASPCARELQRSAGAATACAALLYSPVRVAILCAVGRADPARASWKSEDASISGAAMTDLIVVFRHQDLAYV
jgi:hypothetical protein